MLVLQQRDKGKHVDFRSCVNPTNVVSLYCHVWQIYIGKVLVPLGKLQMNPINQVSNIPISLMQWFFFRLIQVNKPKHYGHSEISRAFNSCVQAIEIDKCKKIFYGCHNRNIHLKKALNETHATSKARFSQEASKASLSISDQSAGVPNYLHACM